MRRVLLITIALCILVISLATTSGGVHAQARTDLVSQYTTIANDQPSYPFWAGGWGYGYCFSHADIQSLDTNSGHGRTILLNFAGWRFGGPEGFVATLVVEGMLWYLESIDKGNGDCIAWAYGDWWLPVAWGR